MGDLGYGDGARNVVSIGSRAYKGLATATTTSRKILTRVLENKLHVEDGDNLAFALADINITIHRLNLADIGLDVSILGFQPQEVLLKPFLGPGRDILVDPMPVIRVVQDHRELL